MGYASDQVDLVSKIVKGELKQQKVVEELDEMEAKYGKECFNSYPVKRKPKPWSMEYLKELERLSSSGASSREFYLYISEVSDDIYRKRKNKIIIIALIVIIAAAIACVLLVGVIGGDKQTKEETLNSISYNGDYCT